MSLTPATRPNTDPPSRSTTPQLAALPGSGLRSVATVAENVVSYTRQTLRQGAYSARNPLRVTEGLPCTDVSISENPCQVREARSAQLQLQTADEYN